MDLYYILMLQIKLYGSFVSGAGWEGEGGCIWKFRFEHGTEELLCDQERSVGDCGVYETC